MQTICPKCNSRFSVSDEFQGRKARCLKCKTLFVVGGIPSRKTPSRTSQVEIQGGSERFYSVKDLAELFNVNPMTIYRMVDRGELTCYQIGRVKRFRPSDIENFLENNSSLNSK